MQKMQKKKSLLSTKTVAYSAMLTAISVVLARLIIPMPNEFTRFSIEAVPIFLAGMFFGPVVGGCVGFAADAIGCLFSAYGYNPIYCVPPILYGVCGGVLYFLRKKEAGLPLLCLSFAVPVIAGSVFYQSWALGMMMGKGFGYFLSTRSIQFAVTYVLDVTIIYCLVKSRIFHRMGLLGIKKEKKMNVEQALSYILSVSWKGSVPGLERTQELLRRLGNPEKQLKFVHIGGTNGKGSTAAMTASVLKEAGYKTGMYTSPHLYKFHERIQINGSCISDADLAAVTEYVKPFAETMEDLPTEFELVFCIAAEYFKRMGCDIVVLEVGMGGALDATNVIEVPEVAVLTNIGLDHTGFLGNTVEEIALTKAGIFKDGGTAVIYPNEPSVEAVLEQVCAQRQVTLHKVDFSELTGVSHGLEGQVFHCGNRKDLQLPLLGEHQLFNAAVVLKLLDVLQEKGWNITEEHIRAGLAKVTWPGRFDIAGRDPLFIIDGGHNPQCLDALVKNILDYLKDRKIIALTGVLADKDYGEMYRPVLPYIREFVCITPPNERKLEAAELAEHLKAVGAEAVAAESIAQGVAMAKEKAGKDGVVLCFGSLYSIGQIREAL